MAEPAPLPPSFEPAALPAHLGLTVVHGPVPRSLPAATDVGTWAQVLPDRVLVRISDAIRVLVEGGTTITYQVSDGETAEPGLPDWVVYGWGVALAHAQRGHLVLHGSSSLIDGNAVCVAGPSGAGKTTTSVALHTKGHQPLVDDVSILDMAPDPRSSGRVAVSVLPYLRAANILPDSAGRLGIDYSELPRLTARQSKSALTLSDPGSQARTLAAIILLDPDPQATAVGMTEVRGADRIALLDPLASRRGVAPLIMGRDAYFAALARLSDSVRLVRLVRPTSMWCLDDVIAAIEAVANDRHPLSSRAES